MTEMTAEHQLQVARDVLIEREREELAADLKAKTSEDLRKAIAKLEKEAQKEIDARTKDDEDEKRRFDEAVEGAARHRLAELVRKASEPEVPQS